MKKKTVFLLIIFFTFCESPFINAQSIYFNFKDGSSSSYLLTNVRSITFTGNVLNLNKTNGITDSWDLNTIENYNFTGTMNGIQKNSHAPQSNFYVYPNPSNGPITIEYDTDKPGDVAIEIYDLNGKKIKTFLQSHQIGGNYKVVWDSNNESGNIVNTGIYICKIKMGGNIVTKKIILTN